MDTQIFKQDIDTILNHDYEEYRESLLSLEEKLIELQTNNIFNDKIIECV